MADIPKKSKAAFLVEYAKPLEIRELPIPEVEPRAILIKVELCGICGTDIHQCRGTLAVKAPLPNIPGHETLGRIVKLGEGRTHDAAGEPLHIGDRIIFAHVDCGECYWCKITDQPTLCANRNWYAFRHSDEFPHLMGGFSEYEYLLPTTEVVKVPDELTDEEVVGAACAFRSVVAAFERLGGIGIQNDVAIQGAGPIGLYSLLLALEGGARTTVVVGAPQERLDLAKKWGANHVINIDELGNSSERKDRILDLTNGRGPDIVIEGSGAPTAFQEGLEMIRKGGKYLIIGQTSRIETPVTPNLIVNKSLDVMGSISATISHYYRALQFVKNKRRKYTFADIVTNKYSLEQVNDALSAMQSGREIKPVIDNRER